MRGMGGSNIIFPVPIVGLRENPCVIVLISVVSLEWDKEDEFGRTI